MNVRTFLENAGLAIVIGAVGLSTAATFLVLTQQWGIATKLTETAVKLDAVTKELTDFKAQSAKDGIDLKVRSETILSTLQDVQRQVQTAQADVGAIMTSAGLPIDGDINWASIGRQVIGFPQTEAAEASLQEKNYQQIQVTPAVGGYVLDDASARIVQATIEQQQGRDRTGSAGLEDALGSRVKRQ